MPRCIPVRHVAGDSIVGRARTARFEIHMRQHIAPQDKTRDWITHGLVNSAAKVITSLASLPVRVGVLVGYRIPIDRLMAVETNWERVSDPVVVFEHVVVRNRAVDPRRPFEAVEDLCGRSRHAPARAAPAIWLVPTCKLVLIWLMYRRIVVVGLPLVVVFGEERLDHYGPA